MNNEIWLVIFGLAVSTFAVRLAGVLLGQRIPNVGPSARALKTFPGCLILSLVLTSLFSTGVNEWVAAIACIFTSVFTRNLPLTMLVGILTVFLMRL